jgi:alcohol dehydrogenase
MSAALPEILRHSPVEVVCGAGCLAQLGGRARDHGARHVLLVTDPGIAAAGHAGRARESLLAAGLRVTVFDAVIENPTTVQVAAGVRAAAAAGIDCFAAVGGGSVLDAAKGVNLILTNGGEIRDYWGIDKARPVMLPLIAVPTTAGTGSEAQSFALISDAQTCRKMACGVRAQPKEGGLRPRAAILDPELTASQPLHVARAAGIDALAHALETSGCRIRNDISREFSRQAWARLAMAYEASVSPGGAGQAHRTDMLLGAHLAGCAIEHSMLGAVHACANPLTARFGIAHGLAVGFMLSHVVAFNTADGRNPYADIEPDAAALMARIRSLQQIAGLPQRLSQMGVPRAALAELAGSAAQEWTAQFNPRPVDATALGEIYERAW